MTAPVPRGIFPCSTWDPHAASRGVLRSWTALGIAFRIPHRMNVLLQSSERFGHMLSRTLLTLLYFLVLGPFAIGYRLVADPLHLRRRKSGNWTRWTQKNDSLARARKQD